MADLYGVDVLIIRKWMRRAQKRLNQERKLDFYSIIINFIGQFLKPAHHHVQMVVSSKILVILFAQLAMLVARVAQEVLHAFT